MIVGGTIYKTRGNLYTVVHTLHQGEDYMHGWGTICVGIRGWGKRTISDNWKSKHEKYKRNLQVTSKKKRVIAQHCLTNWHHDNYNILFSIGKWFEPRGISYFFIVITWVRVVFRKTAVGDCCFDYLSGSNLQALDSEDDHRSGIQNVMSHQQQSF